MPCHKGTCAMKKIVLALVLLFAAVQSFAMEEGIDESGLSYDQLAAMAVPDPYIDIPHLCLEYQKMPECISPDVCELFIGVSVAAIKYAAMKKGYQFVGAIIPDFSRWTGQFCKKPHCYDVYHCIRYAPY
jgi:hypothetical protein